jgi:hypothetical protein
VETALAEEHRRQRLQFEHWLAAAGDDSVALAELSQTAFEAEGGAAVAADSAVAMGETAENAQGDRSIASEEADGTGYVQERAYVHCTVADLIRRFGGARERAGGVEAASDGADAAAGGVAAGAGGALAAEEPEHAQEHATEAEDVREESDELQASSSAGGAHDVVAEANSHGISDELHAASTASGAHDVVAEANSYDISDELQAASTAGGARDEEAEHEEHSEEENVQQPQAALTAGGDEARPEEHDARGPTQRTEEEQLRDDEDQGWRRVNRRRSAGREPLPQPPPSTSTGRRSAARALSSAAETLQDDGEDNGNLWLGGLMEVVEQVAHGGPKDGLKKAAFLMHLGVAVETPTKIGRDHQCGVALLQTSGSVVVRSAGTARLAGTAIDNARTELVEKVVRLIGGKLDEALERAGYSDAHRLAVADFVSEQQELVTRMADAPTAEARRALMHRAHEHIFARAGGAV